MTDNLIKKIEIKEDFYLIAGAFVDLGKVTHVSIGNHIDIFFLGGSRMWFHGYNGGRSWKDGEESAGHVETKEEFDEIVSFLNKRFKPKGI